jgi:hypothetical protein
MEMSSPRRTSTGEYATVVSVTSFSQTSPYTGVMSDLPESSKTLAKIRIHEHLVTLPSRSWIGKQIIDSLNQERVVYRHARELAERIWSSLIEFEQATTEVGYFAMNESASMSDLGIFSHLTKSCWEKFVSILEATGALIIHQHPAYIRSPVFEIKKFISMIFVKMTEESSLRRRLIRCLNLMDSVSTVSNAEVNRIRDRLIRLNADPGPDSSTQDP